MKLINIVKVCASVFALMCIGSASSHNQTPFSTESSVLCQTVRLAEVDDYKKYRLNKRQNNVREEIHQSEYVEIKKIYTNFIFEMPNIFNLRSQASSTTAE